MNTTVELLMDARPSKKSAGYPDGSIERYKAQTVRGIRLPGEATIPLATRDSQSLWRHLARKTVETVTMDESRAERLARFATDYLTPGGRGHKEYTCITSNLYICGFSDEVVPRSLTWNWKCAEPTRSLQAGEPYVLIDEHDKLPHVTMGTDNPSYGFGVIGRNMDVEYTHVDEMVPLYRAERIQRVLGAVLLDPQPAA